MFTKKDRKIANQKSQIKNRDKLLYGKILEIRELKDENLAVHEENKDLRFEIEEQNDLTNSIIKELYSTIKTDKQKVDKIKELVSDYQSNH